MALRNKTSRSQPASYTPGLVPEFPRANAALLDTPGFQEQDAKYNTWWDEVKNSLFKTEQTNGINIHRNGVRITEEATARSTADGFLEGKYTLTVEAGDVVTGMEITSSTGPNAGTVSDVTFRADTFKIYSGTTKKIMFVADAIQDKVRMANVFTVDGDAEAIYIKTTAGAGSWGDAGTAFYADSTGSFSLKDKFLWDGVTDELAILATGVYIGMLPEASDPNPNQVIDGFTLYSFTGGAFGGTSIQGRTASGTQGSKSPALAGSNFGILAAAWNGSAYTSYARLSWALNNDYNVNKACVFSMFTSNASNQNNNFEFNQDGQLTLQKAGGSPTAAGRIHIQGTSGASDAIVFDSDTNLYRSGSNALKTDDDFTANSFTGSGSGLTSLNASNISSGTLNNARLAFSPGNLASANISGVTGTGDVPITGFVTIGAVKLAVVA